MGVERVQVLKKKKISTRLFGKKNIDVRPMNRPDAMLH